MSYGLLLTTATALVACGEPAQPETPQGGTTTAATEVPSAPPPATTDPMPPTPTATATADMPPAPAPKAAKEKWTGKFAQDFSGDVKTAAEETAKKAAGKADKDGKKFNASMEKSQKAIADMIIENTADTHTFTAKGKVAHKIGYMVASGDTSTLTIKLGKDETTKKDLKGAEIMITFSDDDTFSLKDPFAKDPKKAATLVFKRQK
ncbi:MAG: hypothetical protein ABI193_03755 [Minicystis sp.]